VIQSQTLHKSDVVCVIRNTYSLYKGKVWE